LLTNSWNLIPSVVFSSKAETNALGRAKAGACWSIDDKGASELCLSFLGSWSSATEDGRPSDLSTNTPKTLCLFLGFCPWSSMLQDDGTEFLLCMDLEAFFTKNAWNMILKIMVPASRTSYAPFLI